MFKLLNDQVVRVEDGAIVPDDPNNRDRQTYNAWLAGGNVPVAEISAVTPEMTIAAMVGAVQNWLDAGARAYGYDGILSASSYATSKNPRFGPEGIAYRDWRDAVWTYCYQALADVQAARRAAPSAQQLIAELPPAPVFT